MKISETTTLAELELLLRSHGLVLEANYRPVDARVFVILRDFELYVKGTVDGSIVGACAGSTLADALAGAYLEALQRMRGSS